MVTQEPQLEQGVHILLVGQHVGLQEPELEDLEGVAGRDVLNDVHHLRQGRHWEGGHQ